jgi:hypothetical protein
MTLLHDLVNIAAQEGERAFIDTAMEMDLTSQLLESVDDSDCYHAEMITQALNVLDDQSSYTKLQINIAYNRHDICDKTSQDCYQLLIPVPKDLYAVFPLYSGGGINPRLDYKCVTPSEWEWVISDLTKCFDNPEDERVALAKVATQFDRTISFSRDIGGYIGNLFTFMRGQQNCMNETMSLAPLLHILSAEGYLGHHIFDHADYSVGVTFFHYAAKFQEKEGENYVLDTWSGEALISEEEYWYSVQEARRASSMSKEY